MEITSGSSPRKETIMMTIDGRKVLIEGATIVPALKNFGGDKFGPSGMRDFVIAVSDEEAAALTELGYNIFYFNTQDDEGNDIAIPELKIRLRFDKYPPKICVYYGDPTGAVTIIDEDNVDMLNGARFLNCDISFTPYNWERNGKKGTTAYLKTMIVIIPKNDFADKYPGLY